MKEKELVEGRRGGGGRGADDNIGGMSFLGRCHLRRWSKDCAECGLHGVRGRVWLSAVT